MRWVAERGWDRDGEGQGGEIGRARLGEDELAVDYMEIVSNMAMHTSWTRLRECNLPPESCAPVTSTDDGISEGGITRMMYDWQKWRWAEREALTNPDAASFVKQMYFFQNKCVRLLFMLFERDGWRVTSVAGQRYAKAILFTPPDNVLIENIHNYLRDLKRSGRSDLSSNISRTSASVHSDRLQERGIRTHMVDREYFRTMYHEVKNKKITHMFNPRNHDLPTEISRIMTTKYWSSPNPESLRTETAAWVWLDYYCNLPEATRGPLSLLSSWITKALVPHTIVCNVDEGTLWWTLACSKYTCPAIPVSEIPDSEPKLFRWDFDGGLRELHVLDVTRWLAIPTRAIGPKHLYRQYPTANQGVIHFQQVDNARGILKHKMMVAKIPFTHEDMVRLCLALGLESGGTNDVLRQRLMTHVTQGDSIEEQNYFETSVASLAANLDLPVQ